MKRIENFRLYIWRKPYIVYTSNIIWRFMENRTIQQEKSWRNFRTFGIGIFVGLFDKFVISVFNGRTVDTNVYNLRCFATWQMHLLHLCEIFLSKCVCLCFSRIHQSIKLCIACQNLLHQCVLHCNFYCLNTPFASLPKLPNRKSRAHTIVVIIHCQMRQRRGVIPVSWILWFI